MSPNNRDLIGRDDVNDLEAILAITNTDVDAVVHDVGANIDSIFTWDYERSRLPLVKLYEKAKTSQWNASTDLDWSIDVDQEAVVLANAGQDGGFFSGDIDLSGTPFAKWTEKEWVQLGIEGQNWNNLRTVYTHGYGLVAAYGNKRQSGGEPEWIVRDIPPQGKIDEHEPRIYFGEIQTDYSIVGAPEGSPPIELDTPGGGDSGNPTTYTYQGKGGVPIGSFWHRLLYAAKFADVNILLSDRVNSDSKIIYDRTPRERVQKAAPWLKVDGDPYPAVVDGRIVWIVDGYTTSNSYPYAQRVGLNAVTSAWIWSSEQKM